MAVSKARARGRIIRRQGILTAAVQVFIHKGFRAATMEEIAEACDIGVGTLYHYFKSKEELFSSILSESTRILNERLVAAAAKRLPPALSLVAIARAYVDFFSEKPEYFRIYIAFQQQLASRNGFAEEREKLHRLIGENFTIFADKIREGQRAGAFRAELDPVATAMALWASYTGVLSVGTNERLLGAVGVSMERLLAASAALNFSGLGTGPAVALNGDNGATTKEVSLEDLREVVRSSPWLEPSVIFDGMHIAFQPHRARGVHEIYRFDIRGRRGGVWTVRIADGTMQVSRGAVGAPTVTIEMEDRRFVELSTGDVEGLELIVKGEMRIDGNLQRAAMFQEFFVPEAPAMGAGH